ncbi:hypothetical protein [Marinactinospora rubrisoli]|uniref:NurA domain-containing protein n=1 Tax=Marinactinospora rubrisoli TaxID=2715399 RepID=A0ABW2KK11_9ACTN
MFDLARIPDIQQRIREATARDSRLLDGVLGDVRTLRAQVRPIQPRHSSAVSLVASDGGNNQLRFNPFTLQVVRIVDSHGVEMFLDVVSPSTDTVELGRRHLDDPHSVLGTLMRDLGVTSLAELTPMIPPRPRFAQWPAVFRDLCEWAVLYDLVCYRDWGTNTLIVRDGLLRSRIFAGDLFHAMYERMWEAIAFARRRWKRDIFLVGIAKRSEVVDRYRLAMSIADLFPTGHPYYAAVPYELQRKIYGRADYIRPPDDTDSSGDEDVPRHNMGAMHLVRFGGESGDPVWTVDLLHPQRDRAQEVFGSLLYDAQSGFPMPYYPLSLQEADQHAQVADFDLEILQDSLEDAVREHIDPERRHLFDAFNKLYVSDVAARRYR